MRLAISIGRRRAKGSLTNQRGSVIVLASPAGVISTHRTLNQLRGLVEMGLIHFPAYPSLSGQSKAKYSGRRVRCISPKRPHEIPDLPDAERKAIVVKALKDLNWRVFMLGDLIPGLMTSTAKYLAIEAPHWRSDWKHDDSWTENLSIREIEVLRGAALRLAKALEPINAGLGLDHQHSDSQQQQA